MEKQNRLLTFLALALLLGVAFLVLDPRRDQAPPVDDGGAPTHPLFSFKAETITGLALTSSAGTLTFTKADGSWVAAGEKPPPLDQRKVSEIVDRFSTLKVEEHDIQGNDADYGLDDAQKVEVAFTDAEGKRFVTWIGADTAVGYRTYLRETTSGPVQLASSKIGDLVHRRLEDFRSKDVWTFSSATARRVVFETPGRTVVLRKDDHGWWLGDAGPRADEDAVRTWLYSVESLRADQFLDGVDPAAVGLSPAAATLRIEDDAGTHTLALAAPDDKPGRVAQGDGGLVRLTADAPDPVKLDGWLASKILPVRRIQIDRLEAKFGDHAVTFTRKDGQWSDADGKPAIAVDGFLDKLEAVKVDRSLPAARPTAPWGTLVLAEGEQRREQVDLGPAVDGAHAAQDANGGPAFVIPAADITALVEALPAGG